MEVLEAEENSAHKCCRWVVSGMWLGEKENVATDKQREITAIKTRKNL